MRRLCDLAAHFLHDESAATMVEYSIMVALIAAVCFAIISTMGTSVQGLFSTVATAWAGA